MKTYLEHFPQMVAEYPLMRYEVRIGSYWFVIDVWESSYSGNLVSHIISVDGPWHEGLWDWVDTHPIVEVIDEGETLQSFKDRSIKSLKSMVKCLPKKSITIPNPEYISGLILGHK